MTTTVSGLSIDCADPVALAGFWSEVLGRPVNPGADAEGNEFDLVAARPAAPEPAITY
jgi:Glyoxalase-like domain